MQGILVLFCYCTSIVQAALSAELYSLLRNYRIQLQIPSVYTYYRTGLVSDSEFFPYSN